MFIFVRLIKIKKMDNSDSKFYNHEPEMFNCGGGSDKYELGGNSDQVFDINNVADFVAKIKSEIKTPEVSCRFSTLGGNDNVSILLTVSKDKREDWKNGILENSNYASFHIYKNGTVEKISGSLPKLRRFKSKTQDALIEKLNTYINEPEKFEDGGNTEDGIQTKYYPASSDICVSLDTHVPSAMANEQRRFNQNLKTFLLDKYGMSVEQYVAKKLHYKSVDDLCYGPEKIDYSSSDWRNLLKNRKQIVRFAQEQIDAIATAIFNYEEKGDAIIIADQTGVGKGRSQPLDAQILTINGFVRMGDLKVGSKIISVDGNETKVTGIFPQGEIDVYEVLFTDGTKTECSHDHLWATKDKLTRDHAKKKPDSMYAQWKVKTLKEIEKIVHKSVSIPLVSQVNFKEQEVPIDPYLLGVILGDGCIRHHAVQLTNADDELLQFVKEIISHDGLSLKPSKYKYHYDLTKSGKRSSLPNKLITGLRKLNLTEKTAAHKFIPEVYKINTPEIRLAVLQGLVDTDGYVSKTGVCQYYSTSERLADDVVFLVQSLGGIARKSRRNGAKRKESEGFYLPSFTITIAMPNDLCPVRILRKKNRLKDRTKYPAIKYIKSIKKIGKKECQCISVAHESHLYVTDNFIVTHNTAAGVMRYAILDKQITPFFFTEKKHLINDIYRDLVDIGFDAGVPQSFKKNVTSVKTEFTDEEIVKIILKDIKDDEDVRVEYDFEEDFEIEWLKSIHDESDKNYEKVQTIMDELIELYRMKFTEEGYSKDSFERNMNYTEQVMHAESEGRLIVEPYFPNRGDIVDINGNILYGRMTDTEMKTILAYKKVGLKFVPDWEVSPAKLNLPSKYKLFAIPYSQTKSPYSSKKAGKQFLKPGIKLYLKYANNSVVILDESHTASGGVPGKPSNTFTILSQIIKSSAMTTYLSATYAKRASNMPLYAMKTSMRESGLSDVEMIMAFLEGETALQEAVSVELTRNGQLLRREKKIEGKSDYYYAKDEEGDAVGIQQRLRMNKVADLFSKIRAFQVSVHEIVKEYRDELPTRSENNDKLEGSKEEVNKSRTIKALTFQMFNFFLLGLKVQQTVGFSLEKLNAGKKTIITVANTMESALNNMSKTFLTGGATDIDKYKVGDEIENDFKLYIAYLLNYTMRWSKVIEIVDESGEKTEVEKTIYVLDDKQQLSEDIKDALFDRYKELLAEILATTTGVSIAPIDEIKRKIKDAGYSVNEITGRQLCVEFSGDDFSKGKVAKRDVKPTTTLVREFNENKIDCLVINQSGAVGISMHATPNAVAHKVYESTTIIDEDGKEVIIENAPKSLKDKSEVKKRAMVITQMELDISKEVQKLGRINRTGQVYQPEFFYIISAIPSEARLTALMERKLRSLSANVSAEQTQSSYMFTSDDFYSVIAIEPFNETMKDLNQRTRAGKDNPNDIREYTKGLYFADFDFQKNFYDTFSKKLNAEIIRLTAQGLYNGKMSSKDYKAELVNKYPFFIGDEKARTSFGRHGFIEESIVTQYRAKNIDKQIAQAIDERLYLKLHDYASDVSETTDDKSKSADLKFFSSIPLFKASAVAALDKQHATKQKSQLETIDDVNKKIAEDEAELIIEKNKLKGFGNLLEALDIEKQIDENSVKIKELSSKIAESALSGNTDDMIKYGTEIAPLKQLEKSLNEKLASFGDISEEKTKQKLTTRAIKQLETDIERSKTRITSYTNAMSDWNDLNATCKDYVNKIGSVVMYTEYKEVRSYLNEQEETQVDVQSVSYEEVISEPCVITGVTFPFSEDELVPSSVDVYLTFVSRKDKLPLSKLNRKFSEEQKAMGYQNTIKLIHYAPDYKDVWNGIAGKLDSSYKETKWFIAGTLLKTFIMSKQNGLNGTITKYTTSDNKGRIGIEITNKIDANNPSKGTYTSLAERYSVENSLQYPVYFDGNPNNVHNLISKYVYWFMFGKLYDMHKNHEEIDRWKHSLQRSNSYVEFLFQISSQIGFSGIIIRPSNYLVEESSSLLSTLSSDEKIIDIEEMDFETFESNLQVELITSHINYSDGFAMLLKQQGVEITESNYECGQKSNYFPTLANNPRKKNYYINGNLLFKQIFPTNVVDLQNRGGAEWSNKVKMSYVNFLEIIKELDERKQRPSFTTGSEFFSKASSMYILEQFIDEMEVAQVEGEQITFDSSVEGSLEKEIDLRIDELVKLLVD